MHKPIWRLNCLYLNCDVCVNIRVSAPALQSRIMTKLHIKLYISNSTKVSHGQKQSWEIIQTRCDQLTGPHGSCQILHCWYTSQTPCSPLSQKSEEWIKLITENHVLTSSEIKSTVEKSVFSIWVDLFLCRSIQLLVLFLC